MPGFRDQQIDSATIRAVRRGNRAAQARLYQQLSPAVFGMALRILQDHGLAQEALQDTFVQVLERAGSARDEASFVFWVRRIAVNQCLMRLRSPWTRRQPDAEVEIQRDSAEHSDRWHDLVAVERALAAVPPETRAVLWLHDVEGYSHKEIGRLVGKSASYSKSQRARGYARIQQWLKKDDDADDNELAANGA